MVIYVLAEFKNWKSSKETKLLVMLDGEIDEFQEADTRIKWIYLSLKLDI